MLKRAWDYLGGRVFSASPWLLSLWGKAAPLVREEDRPFVPLGQPLEKTRLALITTAGLHHPDQPPFDMRNPQGDASLRRLEVRRLGRDYRISHDYYDSRDVLKDLNIVLPVDCCQEWVQAGRLGALHEVAYSLMGHLGGAQLDVLRRQTAPALARELQQAEVQAALLTPA